MEPLNDYAWDQTVDNGRFRCTVEQTGDGYQGTLKVVVVSTGDVLLQEEVGVSYAARFGPDVADVAEWQEKSIQVIDEYIAKAG
jgi:hypothetical protein